MKVIYRDQIKFAIRDAKKEASESMKGIDTILLYSYEFENLVLSYPKLSITTDDKGKHRAVLDGVIIIEL